MPKAENMKKVKKEDTNITITPMHTGRVRINIEGTAPYVQLRFSEGAKSKLLKQYTGEVKKNKKDREPKNVEKEFKESMYIAENGKYGINAASFRTAAISACKIVGYKMTLAKLSIFIEADDFDKYDGTPLIYIKGKPESRIDAVRNANGGTDLRVRAMWRKWQASVTVRYDASQFSAQDIFNLFNRVGQQVGIGEGRPDSRNSTGMGWGLFTINSKAEELK